MREFVQLRSGSPRLLGGICGSPLQRCATPLQTRLRARRAPPAPPCQEINRQQQTATLQQATDLRKSRGSGRMWRATPDPRGRTHAQERACFCFSTFFSAQKARSGGCFRLSTSLLPHTDSFIIESASLKDTLLITDSGSD